MDKSTLTDDTIDKGVSRGILAALLSRGIGVLAPLITVPLGLQHLGSSAYGAWTAAVALTAFTAFADLGLGVGLMTRLAATVSHKDYDRARTMVSTAYVAVASIVACLVLFMWVSSLWIDWSSLVGGNTEEMDLIVLATLTIFLINVIAGLIVRVQYAVQEVARSNIWQASGSLFGIVGVTLAVAVDSSPPMFVLLASGSPAIVALVNAGWFFIQGLGRDFRPSLKMFDWLEARTLFGLGLRFLVINVLLSLCMSVDPVIIANTVGLDAVPEFVITARLFSMLSVVVGALSIPLWTANVRALQANDLRWVKVKTRKMVVLSGVSISVLAVFVVALAPRFMEIWLDGSIEPPLILLVGLALTAVLQAVAAPYFMVQNAAEVLAPQTVAYALLLLTLPIKWFVAGEYGVAFVPWVTALGYGALILPAALRGYRKSLMMQWGEGKV